MHKLVSLVRRIAPSLIAAAPFALACGGGGGGGNTDLTGSVIDGPVSGAAVSVSAVDDEGQSVFVAQVTTNQQGTFALADQQGPRRLDVANGFFVDQTTSPTRVVSIGSRGGSLRAYVPGSGNFAVTPLSTLGAVEVERLLDDGVSLALAIDQAGAAIARAFEGPDDTNGDPIRIDPIRTIPANLTTAQPTGVTPEKVYAAILEGLSGYARALDLALPPPNTGNGTITAVELTRQLVLDAQDGRLDGVDASSGTPVDLRISGQPIILPGETFGSMLADAIVAAGANPRLPGLGVADAAAIAAAMADAGSLGEDQPSITAAVTSAFAGTPNQVHQLRGGDSITITGTNFQQGARVFLSAPGGVAVEMTDVVVAVNGVVTTITADTPVDTNAVTIAAGLRTITVINPGNRSASALQALRVIGPPVAGLDLVLTSATVDVDTGGTVTGTSATPLLDANGTLVLSDEPIALTAVFTPDATAGTGTAAALVGATALTNAAANFGFDATVGQQSGTLAITATTGGGATDNVTLTVTPGATADIALASTTTTLVANGTSTATIAGEVVDQFGNGVADATLVTLAADTGTVPASASTLAGAFSVTFTSPTAVGTGTATVTATVGAVTEQIVFNLLPDIPLIVAFDPGDLTVSSLGTGGLLPQGGAVAPRSVDATGIVTDINGNPRPGEALVVTITAGPATAAASATTALDGTFAISVTANDVLTGFDGAAPALATVQVQAGSAVGTKDVAVIPGAASSTNLLVNAPATAIAGATITIAGSAKDASGNPVLAGTVVGLAKTLVGATDGAIDATATVGLGGAFSFGYTAPESAATNDVLTATVVNATGQAAATKDATIDVVPDVPTAIVNFAAGVTTLSTDGTNPANSLTTNVTGLLQDQFANPVPGATITLSAGNGNIVLPNPASTTTAADGTFSFTITAASTFAVAPTAGTAATSSVTATETSQSVTTAALPLTINPGRPGVNGLSFTAAPPATRTAQTAALTVTGQVRDTGGNFVLDGTGLAVAVAPTTAGTPSATAITTTGGVFTFTVSDLTDAADDPTITVSDPATGAIATALVAVVDIQAAAPDAFDPTPLTVVPADNILSVDGSNGPTSATLAGIVEDEFGNPVPGATVTLTATDNLVPLNTSVTTPADGTFLFTVNADAAELLTVTAPGVAGLATVTVTCQTVVEIEAFTVNPGRPNTLAFLDPIPPATFIASSTPLPINVSVTDLAGNPVLDGTSITITTTAGDVDSATGGAQLTLAAGTAGGEVAFAATLTDAAALTTITISDEAVGAVAADLAQTIDVVAAAPVAFDPTDLAPSTTTVSVDGSNGATSATLSAVVRDAFLNPVPGVLVTIAADDNVLLSPASVTTPATGAFTFTVTADGTQPLASLNADGSAPATVTVTCQTVVQPTAFVVNPGAPALLAISQDDSNLFIASATPFAVDGTVRDNAAGGGNLVKDGLHQVTVSATNGAVIDVATTPDVNGTLAGVQRTVLDGAFSVNVTLTTLTNGPVEITVADSVNGTVSDSIFVEVQANEPVETNSAIDDLSATANVVVGGTVVPFDGILRDAFGVAGAGNPVSGRNVTLTSSDPDVGLIAPAVGGTAAATLIVTTSGTTGPNPQGVFAARFIAGTKAGTTTITASVTSGAGDFVETTTITTIADDLATITLNDGTAVAPFDTRLTVDDGSVGAIGEPQVLFAGTAVDQFLNPVTTVLDLTIQTLGTGGRLTDLAGLTIAQVTPDALGAFSFQLRDVEKTGVVTVRASALVGALTVQDTGATGDFLAGNAVTLVLSVGADTLEVTVPGDTNTTSVTGTVVDLFGNQVEDATQIDVTITGDGTPPGAAVPSTLSPASPLSTTAGAFSTTYTAGSFKQNETIAATAREIDDTTASAATDDEVIALLANVPAAVTVRNLTFPINDPPFFTAALAGPPIVPGSSETLEAATEIRDANANIVENGEDFTVTIAPTTNAPTFPASPLETTAGQFALPVQAGTGQGTFTLTVTSVRNPAATASIALTVEEQVLSRVASTETGHLTLSPPIVLAGDVNGDGDLDVVEIDGSTATAFANLGNGEDGYTAQSSTPLTVAGEILSATLGDVDLDGDLDLVIGTTAGVEVHLFAATAFDAAQTPAAITAITSAVGAVAVRDLDKDGLPDLIALTDNQVLVVLAADLTPLTYGVAAIGSTPLVPGLRAFAIGDVTGDGFEDAVAIDGAEVFVVITDFTVASFPLEIASSAATDATDVALADMDADGDLDLLLALGANPAPLDGNRIQIRRNTGLSGASRFAEGGSNLDLKAGVDVGTFDRVRAADLDNDGETDVIAVFTDAESVNAGTPFGRVVVYRQEGAGDGAFLADMVTTWTGIVPSNGASLELGDFDHDGVTDAIAVFGSLTSPPNGASVARGVAAPAVVVYPAAASVTEAGAFSGATSGDFVRDGDGDLAVIQPDGDVRTVNFNDDGGELSVIVSVAPTNATEAFAALTAADIDGNGAPDLAYDDAAALDRVSLLVNQPTFVFAPAATPQVVRGGGQSDDDEVNLLVAGAYASGPGDALVVNVIDTVGADADGIFNEIRVATNDGAGVLTVAATGVSTANLGGSAGRGVRGFFNADAHLDVAYIAAGSVLPRGDVVVLFGDPLNESGLGTLFQAPPAEAQIRVIVAVGGFNGFEDIAAADFNNDGTTDILLISAGKATVIAPRETVTGTVFEALAEVTIDVDPTAVAAADFDRDGNLDFAVAEDTGADVQVRIFAGDGEGGFAPLAAGGLPVVLTASGPASQLLAVDLNHDGLPDLAVLTDAGIRVFLTQP